MATRLVQSFSFTSVFFTLVIMLLDWKPHSSVTFISHTFLNFLVIELSFQVLSQGVDVHVYSGRGSRGRQHREHSESLDGF